MPGLDLAATPPASAAQASMQSWQLGAPATGLVWLKDTLVAASGDGRLHLHEPDAARPEARMVHQGAILALASDAANDRVVTGGDDGRVVATGGEGSAELFSQPGRWIDAVAVSRKGQVAAGIGKSVLLWRGQRMHAIDFPATPSALAFDRKGASLAVAHYGGVSLVDPAHPMRAPRRLDWKGSHIGTTFSPDGRFVVSVMGENALHGWRIKDGANMSMSGYPSKPRALSWSADGLLLASSGAGGAIVWSFAGRDGPMGTNAVTVGERDVPVTALAWHPASPVLVLGYRDGELRLCRTDDGATLVLGEAHDESIAHVAFSPAGESLAALGQAGTLVRARIAL